MEREHPAFPENGPASPRFFSYARNQDINPLIIAADTLDELDQETNRGLAVSYTPAVDHARTPMPGMVMIYAGPEGKKILSTIMQQPGMKALMMAYRGEIPTLGEMSREDTSLTPTFEEYILAVNKNHWNQETKKRVQLWHLERRLIYLNESITIQESLAQSYKDQGRDRGKKIAAHTAEEFKGVARAINKKIQTQRKTVQSLTQEDLRRLVQQETLLAAS